MRTSSAFFAGLALALAVPAAAQEAVTATDEAELAEARAIMEIVFPPAEREQTFGTLMEQTLEQFRASLPLDEADPGLRDILDRYIDRVPERLAPTLREHLPLIIDATAVAYTHEFSLEELKDIHAFAQSPSGKRYLQRSSALVGDPAVAAANTAYFADVMEVDGDMRRELIEELNAYLEARAKSAQDLPPPPPAS